MNLYRDKCLQLYKKHLREHFISWNGTKKREERVKDIFNSGSFSHMNDLPFAKEMNDFIGELVSNISKEVFAEKLDEVVEIIVQDMGFVLGNLFSDEELCVIYNFATTDIGNKLLRNLDLMAESYEKGSFILTTEIVSRWSRPEVVERIVKHLISFEEDDQQPQ